MVNQHQIPEEGITIYENNDTNTLEVISVICSPAGLLYRNYLYNNPTGEQINMTKELLQFFQLHDSCITWSIIVGYLIIEESILDRINKILDNKNTRNIAKTKIMAGIHCDLGVFIDTILCDYKVNDVLCSGIPLTLNKITDINKWIPICKLFTETYYEITLLTACVNNIKNGEQKACHLTKIGAGVYAGEYIKHIEHIIRDSIILAIKNIKRKGLNLDIILPNFTEDNIFYISEEELSIY
jgi:hypothetical protein